MPEERQIEDGRAEQAEHRAAIIDQLALTILDHLVGLNRPGRRLVGVVGADVARGVDRPVQLVDVLVAPDCAGRRQFDVHRQAGGEAAGDPGLHLIVEHDLPGELHAAVGVEDLDIGGFQQALGLIIDQGVGAQIATVVAGFDLAGGGRPLPAVVAHHGVGLHIDGARQQAVGAPGRRLRLRRVGQGLIRRLTGRCAGAQAGHRRPGQEAALDRGERYAPR